MDFDFGAAIGFIGMVGSFAVLGMSYIGAFMMGRTRGRREVELEMRGDPRTGEIGTDGRLMMIESAVTSMAQSVERLTDAQRVALLEQIRIANEPPRPVRRQPGYNTPA